MIALKQIIQSELGQVHSIRTNSINNKVFHVKMLDRKLARFAIDTIEKKYGYRLIRIDMQLAELTFWRVQ